MVALGSAGSLATFAPPPGVVRLLIAAELATATAISEAPPTASTHHRPVRAPGRGKCHNRPMRFFNTEGPVRPDDHYAIQPLDRMDVDELLTLIRAKRYFVLHAPRQTGKTSALIALRDLLNSGKAGDFRCVNVNVEVG